LATKPFGSLRHDPVTAGVKVSCFAREAAAIIFNPNDQGLSIGFELENDVVGIGMTDCIVDRLGGNGEKLVYADRLEMGIYFPFESTWNSKEQLNVGRELPEDSG
jgi:hypothetical protein